LAHQQEACFSLAGVVLLKIPIGGFGQSSSSPVHAINTSTGAVGFRVVVVVDLSAFFGGAEILFCEGGLLRSVTGQKQNEETLSLVETTSKAQLR